MDANLKYSEELNKQYFEETGIYLDINTYNDIINGK